MFSNKQLIISTTKPKEDELLLIEFEDTKIEHLPAPITMCKDAPPPLNSNEKTDEKRRENYKKQISNATFLMNCGEKQLDIPYIDPVTSQQITTEAIQQYKSRRVKEDEKYAVICIEDDQQPTISVLDEKWIFSKKRQVKNGTSPMDTPVYLIPIEEKKKKERSDGTETNSHADKSDDEDEMNPKRRKSQDSSESDDEDDADMKKRIEEFYIKQRKEIEEKNEKRKRMPKIDEPNAKRDINELQKLTCEILKKNGNEMDYDNFKEVFGKENNVFDDEEFLKMLYNVTQIDGEGSNMTIRLQENIKQKKQGQKKTKKVVKKQTKKATQQK